MSTLELKQQTAKQNSYLFIFKKNFIPVILIAMTALLILLFQSEPGIYKWYTALAIIAMIAPMAVAWIYFKYYNRENDEANSNEKILFRAGREVKKLTGSIKKTTAPGNAKRNIDISPKVWTQHAVIVGASGSGKTVFVNAIQKQLLNSGAGFLFLDGKGSNSMLRQVYGLVVSAGREKDFILINLGEKETEDIDYNTLEDDIEDVAVTRHSHKYNPLAILDKDSLIDILGDMIDTTGNNAEWAEKAVILGNAIGEILIVLRDLDILIEAEQTIEIKSFEDLKTAKKSVLTFSIFKEYLSSIYNNIALLKMIEVLKEDRDFRRRVYERFNLKNLSEKLEDAVKTMARLDYHKQLKDELRQVDDWKKFVEIVETELQKKDDAEYAHDVAKDYWNKVFSIVTSYADILDTPFSEVDFKDAVMQQKIIYIVLPGLKNKTTTSILAKIIINSIKAVAVQKWKEYQITHPYTCFLDEANVWGEDKDDVIEMISQMYRQTREAGITLCTIHQDHLGKKMGGIYGSANNIFALKVLDKELSKDLEELFGEERTAEFGIKDGSQKKGYYIDEARKEKDSFAPKSSFANLDSGEGYANIKGFGKVRFTTEYGIPVMFNPKRRIVDDIVLPDYMSKKDFLAEIKEAI